MELRPEIRASRTRGLAEADSGRELRSTRDNPYVDRFYSEILGGEPGGREARELLHTTYSSRKRIQDAAIPLIRGGKSEKIPVKVCVGTSCFLKGSQALLGEVLKTVEAEGLQDFVEVSATFCSERCDKGPTVAVGDRIMTRTDALEVMGEVRSQARVFIKGETAAEAS